MERMLYLALDLIRIRHDRVGDVHWGRWLFAQLLLLLLRLHLSILSYPNQAVVPNQAY